MTKADSKKAKAMPLHLIAPCGMNCRLCWGYMRQTNTCPGCRSIHHQESQKSKYRTTCKIKNCAHLNKGKDRYCSDRCELFPCARLKQLDQRYRTKYGMSMIDNLRMIQTAGIRSFIRKEKVKWICPECGKIFCVHRPACVFCGHDRR